MNKVFSYFSLGAAVLLAIIVTFKANADTTDVLPKGRSAINLSYLTDNVTREYDSSGQNRELGYYLNKNNVTGIGEIYLNQKLIAAGVPIPANFDSLALAETFLDARADVSGYVFAYQYGVTDNLTLGVGFPYFTMARSNVDFNIKVVPSAASAAVLMPSPPYPPGFSLADLIMTLDAKKLANQFLHNGFGYDRISDWSGAPGIGDVRLGAKYRFLNTDMFKAAGGGWVDFPTGRPDDERNLTDIAYGSGGYNTGFYAMMDVIPVTPLILNFTGRYVVAWPYDRGVYVIQKNDPVYGNKFYKDEFATKHQYGSYDRGDWYELETEGRLKVGKGMELYATYLYKQAGKDTINGHDMPLTEKMETDLDFGVTASTVDAYLSKEAGLPMTVSLSHRAMLSGKSVEQTNRTYISVSVFF